MDRGELDKLIQLGTTQGMSPGLAARGSPDVQRRPEFEDSDFGRKRYRHKSWLSDIFD